MKRLVFVLLVRWDAYPSQGYSPLLSPPLPSFPRPSSPLLSPLLPSSPPTINSLLSTYIPGPDIVVHIWLLSKLVNPNQGINVNLE